MYPEKIKNSDLIIKDTTSTQTKVTTFAEIIANAKKEGKTVVFSTVASTFIQDEKLPLNWGGRLKGCTNQITELANTFRDPSVIVYIINKRSSDIQSAWLVEKGFQHIHMISDEDGKIQNLLGLDVIELDGNQYLDRVSWVVRPDTEEVTVIDLIKPDDKPQNIEVEDAKMHACAIQQVIPQVISANRLSPFPH